MGRHDSANMKSAASLLVVLSLLSAGALASTLPSPPVPTKNIVEIAAATPDLSTLVAALGKAQLIDTLKGAGPFTVFAPTNEAFAKLPALYRQLLLDPKNMKTLQRLLTYHVAAGAVSSKNITDHEQIRTVEGQDVVAHVTSAGIKINDAAVTTADVLAVNGVVHVVDTVLMPPDMPMPPAPTKNIVELAVATPDLSTLVTALKAASLVEAYLAGPGPFTVFAPTNEAFAKLPNGTLSFLLDPQNSGVLKKVFEYHVVSGAVPSMDLTNNEKIRTVEGGEVIATVVAAPVGFKINDANIKAADVYATNGVVHIIDAVLIPSDVMIPTKDITSLASATPDLSTLVTALKAASLVDTLEGAGPFTVFAPTNEAFTKLPAKFLQL